MILASLALVLTPPAFQEAPVAPASAPLPAVVEYGTDLDLRDSLLRAAAVHADSTGFVVGEFDPRMEHAIERHGGDVFWLPTDVEMEHLWLVPSEHLDLVPTGEGEVMPPPFQRLFQAPAGGPALFAVAPGGGPALQAVLAAGGHGHCGLMPVGRTALRPTPPVVWRGRTGGQGPLALGAGDPRIQSLVDAVDKSNLVATVTSLSSNFSRRADHPGSFTAQADIQGWLNALGLSTSTQQFDSNYSSNVVAELPGTTSPEKIVVIGAHFDSVNWADGSTAISPGADDNASGSSGVIEAARVLSQGGPYEHTLRFVLFSGEEFGLLGSDYNAAQSQAAGEDIIAMLNMDMIAHRAPGDARDADFATNNTSSSLTAFCDATSAIYVPNWASTSGTLTAGSSDHASYNSKGFPAAFFFEDLSQYYFDIHTAKDTMALATTDFDLAKMIVQGVVASAASLAEPVDMTLLHTPLVDTLDGVGPYLVTANVTSQTVAAVASVTLHHSSDGVNFTAVPMADQGGGLYQGLIPGGGSPVTLSYWIEALDSAGGSEVEPAGADLGAAPYDFFVGQKTVLYATDFEGGSDGGWTHAQVLKQDDWQRGAPNGLGGDPSSAASGTSVWGNDLGPSGFNGIYQSDVHNFLLSPSIDASGTTSLNLEFERWLTVEEATYDQAQIFVGGQLVWENPMVGNLADSSWTHVDLDVTAAGAGDPNLTVEFRLVTDGGLEFGGWNIDDFALTVQGPAPAPPAPSFTLSPGSVPAIGWVEVTASGAGMGGVTSVTVAGQSVTFEQGAGQISFLAPAASSLSAADVVVTTAAGSGNAPLGIVPNATVALVGDDAALPGAPIAFTVGSPNPGIAWLLMSPNPGATNVPGFVDLGIGGGSIPSISILFSGVLNPAGNWSVGAAVPAGPGLSGLTLQLEGLVVDLGGVFSASGAHPFVVL